MNKKMGMNIVIGIIIFVVVISVISSVYIGINRSYAASSFSFPIVNGRVKEYTEEFNAPLKTSMESGYDFNMVVPDEYKGKKITFKEKNGNKHINLSADKTRVYAVNAGTGVLVAKIEGTSITTETKFQVIDDAGTGNTSGSSNKNTSSGSLKFAKEYTKKSNAPFKLGGEYDFNMSSVPSGYSQSDVKFKAEGNSSKLIKIINNGREVRAIKVGSGTLTAYIPGTDYETSVSFDVIDDSSNDDSNDTNQSQTSKNINDKLKFAKEYTVKSGAPFYTGGEYDFTMASVPAGYSQSDVRFKEKVLSNNIEVTDGGRKIKAISAAKSRTLVAYIEGTNYEANVKFDIVDTTKFKFAKNYTSETKAPFYIGGGEYNFKMSGIPTGFSNNDVKFREKDDNGLLEIVNEGNAVKAVKAGKGTLVAYIKNSSDVVIAETEAEFEVLDSVNGSSNCYVKITEDSKTLTYSGKSQTVQLDYEEVGLPKGAKLEWTSSDEKVAKVNNSGKVTVTSAGETTITVKYNNIYDSCNIIVKSKDLGIFNSETDKEITGQKIDLHVGDTYSILVKENGNELSNSEVEYISSSGKCCSIDENGNITAIAPGTSTIKGKLVDKQNCEGKITINVIDETKEIKAKAKIEFVKENGKKKEYTGGNAFVLNQEWSITTEVTGVDGDYEVKFSTKSGDYIENVYDSSEPGKNKIMAKNVTSSPQTLIATLYVDGVEIKSNTTKFEIYSTMQEKEEAGAKLKPYMELGFETKETAVQEGKSINVKPDIETNIPKKSYGIEYQIIEGNADWVTLTVSNSTAKIKANDMGDEKQRKLVIKATAVASDSATEDVKKVLDGISDTIEVTLMKELVLVKSISLNKEATLENGKITKAGNNSNVYNIPTNEECKFEFEISPENATISDYTLSVDDEENFMVDGKNVIALTEGKTTKLTATAKDTSNKSLKITINSVLSTEAENALDDISNVSEINIEVGQTVSYKYDTNKSIIKTSSSKARVTVLEKSVTIVGLSKGSTSLTVKENGKTKKINIIVSEAQENKSDTSGTNVPVQKLAFLNKDYVNDAPFQIGIYYDVTVNVFPNNATNQDFVFTVSNTDAFKVVGKQIVAYKPDQTTTLIATSVSNPNVSVQTQVASVDNHIKSIRFVKDYVDKYKFDINKNPSFKCNPIIELDDGTTYNPEIQNLENNAEYQKLRRQIKIETDSENLLDIQSIDSIIPIKGTSGSGTLKMYVMYNNTINATAKFESVGINSSLGIKNVSFARNEYNMQVDSKLGFCPYIELTDGTLLKPSDTNNVSKTPEYQYYLSQLELIKISADESAGLSSTGSLLLLSRGDDRLITEAKYLGTCKLGIGYKDSGKVLADTKINVTEKVEDEKGVDAVIKEVDHATTTTNRNLEITGIKFAKNSYVLDGNFGYHMNPVITLSDGTVLTHESPDHDVYFYYCGLTEIYLTNSDRNSDIDFGVVEIQNRNITYEQPKYVVPLKNGKTIMGIGIKGKSYTYDTAEVTVDIK